MRERDKKRLEPASPKEEAGQLPSAGLNAVH
jgi:hypothetical protein